MYNVGGPCGLATGAAAPCDGVMTDINGWMTMAALPMTSMVSSRDVIKFQIQIYTQMVATVRVAAEHGLLNRIRKIAPIYTPLKGPHAPQTASRSIKPFCMARGRE